MRLIDEGRCFSEGHKLLEEIFEEEKEELEGRIADLKSQIATVEKKLKAEQKGHSKSVQKRDREIEKLKEELSSQPEPEPQPPPKPKPEKPKDLRMSIELDFPQLVSFVFFTMSNGSSLERNPSSIFTVKCAPVFIESFTYNTMIRKDDMNTALKLLLSLDKKAST
jgi:hypothetical protein